MPGFDPRWKDVPDYIHGITEDIWEKRHIHALKDYYADDIIVRSPATVVQGNKGVIAATLATLAEWPDRELPGEDVIWCGHAEEGTLFSSHRLICSATHTHPGAYGAPTGAKLRYRILADCAIRDNQVYDEWLVRDQGAIVRQMGMDPLAFARDQIAREEGKEACVKPLTPANDKPARYTTSGNTTETGSHYADLLTRIMGAEISVININYDRAAQLEYPGGVPALGPKGASEFWIGLRASFPNAQFKIDHVVGNEEAGRPNRAALRWSLHGKHEGWGTFGAPSQADVYILGISHAEFGPRGLHREYVLFDEVAIWKQIVLQKG
ncbi:MAG: ester cyclase [Pseudomonadota bacterium]